MKVIYVSLVVLLTIVLAMTSLSPVLAAGPTVTNVTSSLPNGTYTIGTIVPIQVTYSAVVVVTGTPQLTLSTGNPNRTAVNYSSGSGTSTLTFIYTVAAGNASTDLDYVNGKSLVLNGGTITDEAANNADLKLPSPGTPGSLGANKNIVIDTIGPSVTINQAAGQLDPTNTYPINFSVVFSEVVTDFATGDVSLSGTAGATTAIVTGSGTTYNVAVSGMITNGTVIANIPAGIAHDAVGNSNTASTSTDNTVTYGISALTVTIDQAAGQVDPTKVSPINFTVVFNRAVTDFATGDVSLSGTAGATTAIVTGSGTTYNAAVSGMSTAGTVVANIPAGVAHDSGGSPNTAATFTDNTVGFDSFPPTISIGAPSVLSTRIGPVTYSITYADINFNSSTLNLSNITLNKTGNANGVIGITGSGLSYTVTISSITGNGTLGISIAAGTASDTLGNIATAAGPSSTFTVDNIAPSVSWVSPVASGQVYNIFSQSVQLAVNASDNVGIAMIVFRRWDYLGLNWIDIGTVYNPPYNLIFNASVLLPNSNEIRAFAYDLANNSSASFIWLYQSPVLTVFKAGSGIGLVTSSPSGISCGLTCSYGFTLNTNVTLHATASSPSTFTGWSGSCSGLGNCTVTMDVAKSVIATFIDPRVKPIFLPVIFR